MSCVKNVIFARDKQTRNAIIVDPINVVYVPLPRSFPWVIGPKIIGRNRTSATGFVTLYSWTYMLETMEHTFSSI